VVIFMLRLRKAQTYSGHKDQPRWFCTSCGKGFESKGRADYHKCKKNNKVKLDW